MHDPGELSEASVAIAAEETPSFSSSGFKSPESGGEDAFSTSSLFRFDANNAVARLDLAGFRTRAVFCTFCFPKEKRGAGANWLEEGRCCTFEPPSEALMCLFGPDDGGGCTFDGEAERFGPGKKRCGDGAFEGH